MIKDTKYNWTERERNAAISMWAQFYSRKLIADVVGRSPEAVKHFCRVEGLQDARPAKMSRVRARITRDDLLADPDLVDTLRRKYSLVKSYNAYSNTLKVSGRLTLPPAGLEGITLPTGIHYLAPPTGAALLLANTATGERAIIRVEGRVIEMEVGIPDKPQRAVTLHLDGMPFAARLPEAVKSALHDPRWGLALAA